MCSYEFTYPFLSSSLFPTLATDNVPKWIQDIAAIFHLYRRPVRISPPNDTIRCTFTWASSLLLYYLWCVPITIATHSFAGPIQFNYVWLMTKKPDERAQNKGIICERTTLECGTDEFHWKYALCSKRDWNLKDAHKYKLIIDKMVSVWRFVLNLCIWHWHSPCQRSALCALLLCIYYICMCDFVSACFFFVAFNCLIFIRLDC